MDMLQGILLRGRSGAHAASLQVVALIALALATVLVGAPFQMWRCTQTGDTVNILHFFHKRR